MLSGRVWAESVLGIGSVFYFEFPEKVVGYELLVAGLDSGKDSSLLNIENASLTHTHEHISCSSSQFTTINSQQLTTILIIEDNREHREYLTVLLSDEYNILTAENGKVGYDRLMQNTGCQLIISDLMMLVIDGFEFLGKIKSDERWRHIPVIILTAKVNVKAKLNALRIGVDDYLTKPFVEKELKARIENLLRNYRERMELFSQNSNQVSEQETPNRPVIAEVDTQWLREVEAVLNKLLSESKLTMNRVKKKCILVICK